jgi:hypothetical protein
MDRKLFSEKEKSCLKIYHVKENHQKKEAKTDTK